MTTKPTSLSSAPYMGAILGSAFLFIVMATLSVAIIRLENYSKGNTLFLIFLILMLCLSAYIVLSKPFERRVTLDTASRNILVSRVYITGRRSSTAYKAEQFSAVISYLGGSAGSKIPSNFVVLSDETKTKGILLSEFDSPLSNGWAFSSKFIESHEAAELRAKIAHDFAYKDMGFFASQSEFCDFGFKWND